MSNTPQNKNSKQLNIHIRKALKHEILGQELNKYQNKHLAMYYILLYSNFTGVVGLPGQGVLSGNLLHLTDVHLTLGHRVTQLILRKCERDSRNIHLLYSTQKMLQDVNHNVSHIFLLNLNTGVSPPFKNMYLQQKQVDKQKRMLNRFIFFELKTMNTKNRQYIIPR